MKKLWRIPLIGLAAGLLMRFILVGAVYGWIAPLLQGGSRIPVLLVDAAFFAAVIVIGGRFVKDMTRAEAIQSAGVLVAYGLILWLLGKILPIGLMGYYLQIPLCWNTVVYDIGSYVLGGGRLISFVMGLAANFVPLCFVPFAKK